MPCDIRSLGPRGFGANFDCALGNVSAAVAAHVTVDSVSVVAPDPTSVAAAPVERLLHMTIEAAQLLLSFPIFVLETPRLGCSSASAPQFCAKRLPYGFVGHVIGGYSNKPRQLRAHLVWSRLAGVDGDRWRVCSTNLHLHFPSPCKASRMSTSIGVDSCSRDIPASAYLTTSARTLSWVESVAAWSSECSISVMGQSAAKRLRNMASVRCSDARALPLDEAISVRGFNVER